jgi:chemotaxis regulatin CheY-phosphate phosphatase CheZ
VTEIFNVETREALYALAAELKLLRLQQGTLVRQLNDPIPGYIRARAVWCLTLPDAAAKFEHLLERRDLAAYRVVEAVEAVIGFWEAQDYEASLSLLKRAHAEFERADHQISDFRNLHKGELTCHGNRTA